jgi:hypothetical protein
MWEVFFVNVLLVSGRCLWVLHPSNERSYTISDEVLAFAQSGVLTPKVDKMMILLVSKAF